MTCPKCGLPVEDDTFFCEHCGAPLEDNSTSQSINNTEDMEKTMAIPVVKSGDVFPFDSDDIPEEKSVEKKNPSPSNNVKKTPVKKNTQKADALKLKIILTAISFFVTLIIGLGICALVIFTDDSPETKTQISAQTFANNKQKKEDKVQSKSKPKKIAEGSSEGEKEAKGIPIDAEFEFALGCSLGSLQLSYTEHSDSDLGYSCAIPTSFEEVYENDEEIRYRAEDNTAYVDVGAFENVDDLTRSDVKSAINEELNGEILREENGDGWFIMTTKKDDVVYYIKCFVGDYIKYMEFVNPSQYSSVYDIFINDMEPLFQSVE